jgi:hypothetical protein
VKKFFKIVGIVIGAFIVLGIIAGIVGGGNDTPTQTTAPQTEQADKPAPAKEKPKKVDRKAVYDAIKVGDTLTGEGGDTYETVIAKMGKPDSETESTSGDMKMVMVDWFSLTEGNYSVTFINGKVANKLYSK